MAQGNQIGSAFSTLNSRDPRDTEYVALSGRALEDSVQRGRLHDRTTGGHRDAVCFGLLHHIHHVGAAADIEMRKLGHMFCSGICYL